MTYWYMLKKYWEYAEDRKWEVFLTLFLYVASWIFVLFTPYLFAQILNSLQVSPRETVLYEVGKYTSYWILAYTSFNLFHRAANYASADISYRVKENFLKRSYHVLVNLPLQWHNDHHSGEIIDRLNIAAEGLYLFCKFHNRYSQYLVKSVGPVIILFMLSWQVAVLASVVLYISFFVIKFFDKKIVQCYRDINLAQHKISAKLFDFISNIRTIVTLKLGERTENSLAIVIKEGYNPAVRLVGIWDNIKWFCVLFISMSIRMLVIFYYIALQVFSGGKVLIGNVAGIFQYVELMGEAVQNIAKEYQEIIRYKIALDAVRIITDEEVKIAPKTKLKSNWKNIRIENLSFSYNNQIEVLKNISFEIPRYAKIAVIGESGSGKSTLMTLLRGLFDVENCDLYIDDKKAKHNLLSLSSQTMLMPQDPEIFENTIDYNITMGINYPSAVKTKAIKMARFDRVIEKLPNGLKTDIREKGVNLSGGEKQRLALVRNLLVSDSSGIILMDEPTSSVDVENETAIYDAILKNYKDKTIISSVHKLYLVDKFDYVIKMHRGRIVDNYKIEKTIKNNNILSNGA